LFEITNDGKSKIGGKREVMYNARETNVLKELTIKFAEVKLNI
jgi:hypothetical protein